MDNIKMICAIYARYSSEAQNPRSIDDQIRECVDYAQNQGLGISQDMIYSDAAISGSDSQRPAYIRLKQDATLGLFDCILVDDLSRLGRDIAESSAIFKELAESGVTIISVADGIDTSNPSAKLPYYFKGIMNELFLDDLRAKVVRGLKGQVIRGYSPGGRVYGYKTKQILDPSGEMDKFGRPKRLGCEIIIDDKRAATVNKIFEMKSTGYGYRYIADYLNTNNIPSPHSGSGTRSGFWGRSTIRAIIHQRKYLGDWTWNKVGWNKKSINNKRIGKQKPQNEWVEYKNDKLRIISDEIWKFAHSNDRTNKKHKAGPRGAYLLSGLLKCQVCGSSMVIQNGARHSSYICNGFRNGGKSVCGNNHRLSRANLEEAFFNQLSKLLLSPVIVKELTQRTQQILTSMIGTNKESIQNLKSEKNEIQRQLSNLIKLAENGNTSKAIFDRIVEKENLISSVENRLIQLSRNVDNIPECCETWISKRVKNLMELVNNSTKSIIPLKQEIKNLFPDKLIVTQQKVKNDILFKIKGKLHPLESYALPVSIMSHSGAGT